MSSQKAATTDLRSCRKRRSSHAGEERWQFSHTSTGAPRPACSKRRRRVPGELGTVVVTGGSSGLGAAVVAAVADAGGHPFVLDLRRPDNGVPHELVDLADTSAAASAVERAAELDGGLRGLVTCAGTDVCGRLDEVPGDDWERVVRVNLLGTAAVVRAALPHLERSRGRLVTVASTLGLRAISDATAYCASKFGVVGFTRALAAETANRVGVTLLIPGGMQTVSSTAAASNTGRRSTRSSSILATW